MRLENQNINESITLNGIHYGVEVPFCKSLCKETFDQVIKIMNQTIFHMAFPVTDMAQTKAYYVDGLGCTPGRENRHALILNLYGHQLVAHFTKDSLIPQPGIYPRHFGLVFTQESDWEELLARAEREQLLFRETPKDRFMGSPLEHRTFFLEDPFYNLMEYKYYSHREAIFGSAEFTQVGDTLKV